MKRWIFLMVLVKLGTSIYLITKVCTVLFLRILLNIKFNLLNLNWNLKKNIAISQNCSYFRLSHYHTALCFRTTDGITCFIKRTKDGDERLSWALPLSSEKRCACTKILAQPVGMSPCSPTHHSEYWLTDTPGVLASRAIWNTEYLKKLLDCQYDQALGNTFHFKFIEIKTTETSLFVK